MRLNPMAYGVVYKDLEEDPSLEGHRKKLIVDAGKELDKVYNSFLEVLRGKNV